MGVLAQGGSVTNGAYLVVASRIHFYLVCPVP